MQIKNVDCEMELLVIKKMIDRNTRWEVIVMLFSKDSQSSMPRQRAAAEMAQETEDYLNTMLQRLGVVVSAAKKAEMAARIQEMVMQEALLSDAQIQLAVINKTRSSGDRAQKLLDGQYEVVVEKRTKLQEKWRDMDDSEETRKISHLVFSDFSKLGNIEIAFLCDDARAYEDDGWRGGQYWRENLEIAALLGSMNIGEFILQKQQESLKEEDYGRVLGYVSGSSNEEWAIRLSEKMKNDGMAMPSSVRFFCEDYDLLEKIEGSFSNKQKINLP